jgi:hypothetical protein
MLETQGAPRAQSGVQSREVKRLLLAILEVYSPELRKRLADRLLLASLEEDTRAKRGLKNFALEIYPEAHHQAKLVAQPDVRKTPEPVVNHADAPAASQKRDASEEALRAMQQKQIQAQIAVPVQAALGEWTKKASVMEIGMPGFIPFKGNPKTQTPVEPIFDIAGIKALFLMSAKFIHSDGSSVEVSFEYDGIKMNEIELIEDPQGHQHPWTERRGSSLYYGRAILHEDGVPIRYWVNKKGGRDLAKWYGVVRGNALVEIEADEYNRILAARQAAKAKPHPF